MPLHGSERGAISLLVGGFYSVYRAPRGTGGRCATSTKSLLLIKVENFAGVFFLTSPIPCAAASIWPLQS